MEKWLLAFVLFHENPCESNDRDLTGFGAKFNQFDPNLSLFIYIERNGSQF